MRVNPQPADAQSRKAVLRGRLRQFLKSIPLAERAAASVAACERLEQQEVWHSARTILFYAPLNDELDLSRLWKEGLTEGKIVTLPRFVPGENSYAACQITGGAESLVQGQFGILEPHLHAAVIPLKQLDLVLVPGVAFDMSGRRLGRGKGFYDRLLKDVCGITCGVGFDPQVEPEIPVESHDICLDFILTPTRWLTISHAAAMR